MPSNPAKENLEDAVKKLNVPLRFTSAKTKRAYEKAERKSKNDIAALKRKWGKNYDRKIANAQHAFRSLPMLKEVDLEQIEGALGTRRMLEFFARVGECMPPLR